MSVLLSIDLGTSSVERTQTLPPAQRAARTVAHGDYATLNECAGAVPVIGG